MTLLAHLDHRGARGAEEKTGDGAGILLAKPHEFFVQAVADLPAASDYGVGQLFLPKDASLRSALMELVEVTAVERHMTVVAWRHVPADPSDLGATARASEPYVAQVFVAPVLPTAPADLDVALYLLRCLLERRARHRLGATAEQFYLCSLDRTTIVYKGLLTGPQLAGYYPDLQHHAVASTFALVHSRFSTNTLGAWHLAHPCRRMVHNGEFNTLRGNENWMRAREADLGSPLFGDDVDLIKPVIMPDVSDSAKFDNVLDLLLVAGRSLPGALRMMIPEAWERDPKLSRARRDFYDFHSTIMEPWDGPALVVATDGTQVAAVLDRNGFRPCRYSVTRDRRLVLASEAGVLDLDDADVVSKGRLKPGALLVVDTQRGQLVSDGEVFDGLVDPRYGKWLHDRRLKLPEFQPAPAMAQATDHTHRHADLQPYWRLFRYTREMLETTLAPMAEDGTDPVGAMGSDTPLAPLSRHPQTLAAHFNQLFAQVSNPPLDFIRERVVTSLRTHIGRQGNILAATPEHCHQVLLESPILTEWGLESLRNMDEKGIRAHELDATFDPGTPLRQALDDLSAAARGAIGDGYEILVVSDRRAGPHRLPLPNLLAVAALHHALIDQGLRTRAALVLDVGEPVTVHQFCTLIGFGADAVHPWLALQTLSRMLDQGDVHARLADAHRNYRTAIENGLLKVMSKMGISTLQGYKGAQVFEAVGLDQALIDRYFTGTPAHVPGIDLSDIEAGVRKTHGEAFQPGVIASLPLPSGGHFYWRRDGEQHDWNPWTIGKLQLAARTGDRAAYRAFAGAIDELECRGNTIRGLLKFAARRADAITLDEVEPVNAILRRFSTGSMSFGALSQEAHEALAVAMNRVGGLSGTGEGGEQAERFGTERSCSMKQVASGRFGVTLGYLADARQIEIKISQGSKPGEGGELPGAKVDLGIAEVRFSTPGVGLISPPPHHDIYSIEDLAQLIFDLKCANPAAEVHVKLVACAGVGTIAAGVAKARADAVLISGSSGGTGASIKTSIKGAGSPWELGLAETQQVLLANRLRSRIRVRVDGGMKTGRDVVVGALLGAEEFGFGTAPLVALGCIMLRKCHCNSCSVGVATQDPRLRAGFSGAPEHVINYLTCVAEDVRERMAALGFRTMEDMIGRMDKLEPVQTRLDLSRLLHRPPSGDSPRRTRVQDHGLQHQREWALLRRIEPALRQGRPITLNVDVTNRDRAFGTLTSHRVQRLATEGSLPPDSVELLCRGHAGQSFGAFLAPGISLHLVGDANDYLGKGLSGGRISLRFGEDIAFERSGTTICGNVALYGATSGEAYIAGHAGERFAVRNSGALAVVEGVGDHGCEYMTAGIVVVLGPTGKNFAAGMSGGEVYVLDLSGEFRSCLNQDGVTALPMDAKRGAPLVRRLLENHIACTGSPLAHRLLEDWSGSTAQFVSVVPDIYDRIVRESLSRGRDVRPPLPPPIRDMSLNARAS
jgi:glutamate synthase (NADPH/NADH) large chain